MNMKEFLSSDLLPTEINPFNREQLISDIRDFMEVMSQRELNEMETGQLIMVMSFLLATLCLDNLNKRADKIYKN